MGSTLLLCDMTNPPLYSLLPLCLSQVIACHYASLQGLEVIKLYILGIEAVCPTDLAGPLLPCLEFEDRDQKCGGRVCGETDSAGP